MKNLKGLNLSAALGGFLLVLSLHQSSSAQVVSGTWNGIETYNIELQIFGQPQQFYSGTQSAVFQISAINDTNPGRNGLLDVTMQVTGAFDVPGFGNTISGAGIAYDPQDPFGPTSASGMAYGNYPPLEPSGDFFSGDFSLTYQSIGSDGLIDVGGGSALAHLTSFQSLNLESFILEMATFQAVPEPSSIVMAASGALLVLIVALVRARRASPCKPRSALIG
jgi:hypothetical protein